MRNATLAPLLALIAIGCAATQTPVPEPAPAVAEPAPPPMPEVEPIPEGFHVLTPSLVVADLPAAVDWYTKALGAEHLYTMEGPDGAPMHGEIKIGDSIVMLSSEDPEHGHKAPGSLGGTNGSLHVYVQDVDAAHKAAVDAGAKSLMPVEDMWWGDRFGEIVDPSGHRWSLGTHKEDLTPEVIAERAKAAMAAMSTGKKYTWEKGPAAANFQPEGYHTVTPSLVVKGGPEVVDFYKNALGAEVLTTTPGPDGASLIHAELKVGDSVLMMASEMPAPKGAKGPMVEIAKIAKAPSTLGGASVTLMVYVPDTDAAFQKAVGAGATQVMEPMDMFWGDRFAQVVDPSGTPWGIATHIEDVPPEQIKQRMMEQMGGAPPAEGAPAEGAPAPAPAEPAPK